MYDREALTKLAGWLQREDGFTLTAHVSPDGDTLGSCLALFLLLRAMGKRARIVCDQPVPKVYAFLPGADIISEDTSPDGEYPNIVAVDCADERRMGAAQALLSGAAATAVIDHHETDRGYGQYNLVDPDSAATGELIFALAQELNIPLTKEIAACLYVAINTDTGNFAYSNTTPDTFRIAAQLLETGIDTARINRLLYRTVPLAKMRLLGIVLNAMELHEEGRIGFSSIAMEDYAATGAISADVEGMIDSIRDVDTVEIAILVRVARDNTYKVSFRSKEYADVGALAAAFGGGGHKRAAGCTLPLCPLPELRERLIAAASAALKRP